MTQKSEIEILALVTRLKSRDESAMAEVYKRFAAALYGVASKIVRSDEVAQDVVQDSFVKIWKKVATYDSAKGTFFTWMLNITRNTAIDFLRKTKKENPASIQDIENSVHTRNGAVQNVDTIGLAALVDNLKEDQRLLVEYIYFKGFTQQEVSDELGIPLGTVKTRIRAAVQELKRWFVLFLLIWI